VRFMYTAATGHVGTNADAVAHYLDQQDTASPRLVAAALAWRTDPPADQAAVVELLRDEMLPLYLEYVDDHIRRLSSMGRGDLAGAFEDWRAQLLA
jgi:hypothetical protein